jgi:hypothetical protein
MALRRGFKTEANELSRLMRRELNLFDYDPLCPWKLAKHLGFKVYALSDFRIENPKAAQYFLAPDTGLQFSAVTLPYPGGSAIVHNDGHGIKRQASNLAHELAHALLLHSAHSISGPDGARVYCPEIEEEANWLGPALLISEAAALHIIRRGYSLDAASDIYRTSVEVIRMRLNVCGAWKRVA